MLCLCVCVSVVYNSSHSFSLSLSLCRSLNRLVKTIFFVSLKEKSEKFVFVVRLKLTANDNKQRETKIENDYQSSLCRSLKLSTLILLVARVIVVRANIQTYKHTTKVYQLKPTNE